MTPGQGAPTASATADPTNGAAANTEAVRAAPISAWARR